MATITSTPTGGNLTVSGNTQVSGTISWSKPAVPSGATISSCVLTGTATASMSKGSATITVNGTTVSSGSNFTINLGTANNTTSVTTTAKGGNKNANGTVSFSNLVYTVTYELTKPTYTVTFKDWDGTTLKTQTVEEGSSATAPSNPSRQGYEFTGWDKDFSNITSDIIITAQYNKLIEIPDGWTVININQGYWDWGNNICDGTTYYIATDMIDTNNCNGIYLDILTKTDKNKSDYLLEQIECITAGVTVGKYLAFNNEPIYVTSDGFVNSSYIVIVIREKDYNSLSPDDIVMVYKLDNETNNPNEPEKPDGELIPVDYSIALRPTSVTQDSGYNNTWTNVENTYDTDTSTSGTIIVTGSSQSGFKRKYVDTIFNFDNTIPADAIINSAVLTVKAKQSATTNLNMAVSIGDNEVISSTLLGQSSANYTADVATIVKDFNQLNINLTSAATSNRTFTLYDVRVDVNYTVYEEVPEEPEPPDNPSEDGWITLDVTQGCDLGLDGTGLTNNDVYTSELFPIEYGDELHFNITASNITYKTCGILTLNFFVDSNDNTISLVFVDWVYATGENEFIFNNGNLVYDNSTTGVNRCSITFCFFDEEENIVRPNPEDIRVMFKSNKGSISEPENPIVYYTVTFKDYDGTVLSTQTIEEGHDAVAPADPTRNGYTFKGWSKSFTNVSSNLEVIALYESVIVPDEPEEPSTSSITNIKIGDTVLQNLYIGGLPITKIYIGDYILYEAVKKHSPAASIAPTKIEFDVETEVEFEGDGDYIDTKVDLFDDGNDWSFLIDFTDEGKAEWSDSLFILHNFFEGPDGELQGLNIQKTGEAQGTRLSFQVNDNFYATKQLSNGVNTRLVFTFKYPGELHMYYNDPDIDAYLGGNGHYKFAFNEYFDLDKCNLHLACWYNESQGGVGRFWRGIINEFIIWNKTALSDEQVQYVLQNKAKN